MTHYWIAVACNDHVQKAIAGGFAQVCHGKAGPLKQMEEGDFLIYYSPHLLFEKKTPCQSFTALGKIVKGEPYPFQMSQDFIPWRINVCFLQAKQAPISPLLEKLAFIKDKKHWGFPFKRGCFEISENDFLHIAKAMEAIL